MLTVLAYCVCKVHLFFADMFVKHRLPAPTVIGYDDACRKLYGCLQTVLWTQMRVVYAASHSYVCILPPDLLKFLQQPFRRTSKFTAWLLRKVSFCVDKFHWPNHKDEKFCRKFVDPNKCVALQSGMNLEAAEEVCFSMLHSTLFCAV